MNNYLKYYNGNVIIHSSDRVVINASRDDVYILAKKDVMISADGELHVNLPDGKRAVVNVDDIILGMKKDGDPDYSAVARAEDVISNLEDIISSLGNILKTLASATVIVTGGKGSIPTVNAAAKNSLRKLNEVTKKLNSIKSKKVKVI